MPIMRPPGRIPAAWRTVIYVFTAGLVGVIGLLLVLTLSQRRLLYHPSKFAENEGVQAAGQMGLEPWRDQQGHLIGWKMPSRFSVNGSVLIIHGNAGSALNRTYFADPIHAGTSLEVYILEYPGYGARAGSPSERSFLAAAEEAFKQLPTNAPIYVVSESIGTGPAAHLAKVYGDQIAGMALFVPYGDLVSVAQNHFPYVPVSYLLWDRYAPALWLKDYRGPIKFIIAGQDEIIATKLGQKLYDDYQGPKNLQLDPRARHNGVAEQSPYWWADVLKFWQEHGTPQASHRSQ